MSIIVIVDDRVTNRNIFAKLAASNRYALNFPGGSFKNYEDYRAAARAKVLELLLYRPERIDPRPEVIERADCVNYVREKILFSTSSLFRVPAYVLIPKGLNGPAPAVVNTRSNTLRPASGRSRTLYSGSTEPTEAEVVAMTVSAATVTSTAVATEPTCSVKFSRTCWETPRATPLYVCV